MSPVRMGKIESASRTAMTLYKALNEGDLDGVMALFAKEGEVDGAHPAPDGTVFAGKDSVRAYYQGRIKAADGTRIKIEDLKGLGKYCIVYWRMNIEAGSRRGVDVIFVEEDLIQSVKTYVKS